MQTDSGQRNNYGGLHVERINDGICIKKDMKHWTAILFTVNVSFTLHYNAM